jgi:hypothetical protein
VSSLEGLDALVGEWTMEAGPPDGPKWPGEGRISFEWLDDGRSWLVQCWSVDLPEAPDGIAVIGFKDAPASGEKEASSGELVQHYFDTRGVHRVYEMSLEGNTWKLWREGEPFDQRMTAEISEDGRTISGRWERVEDGEWIVDFDLTYTKVG